MNFFHQGGVMMWPLALVSITVLAIIIDRMLLFSSIRFPGKNFARILSDALTIIITVASICRPAKPITFTKSAAINIPINPPLFNKVPNA